MMVGQVFADATPADRTLNVTDFVRGAAGWDVSFLLAREVRFASAEKHVHADALALGFLRRLESGVQHHADLRRAAGRPPVDVQGAPGGLLPMRGEGFAELLADRLVVGC